MANNARTFKDTFWAKLRVDNGFNLKELAKMVHVDMSSMCHYLTGQAMPPDDVIDVLCKYFDVDPVLGKSEFMKAHDSWVGEHSRKLKAKYNKPKIKKKSNIKPVTTEEKLPEVPLKVKGEKPVDDSRKVLELLYQRVDFKTFMEIFDLLKED